MGLEVFQHIAIVHKSYELLVEVGRRVYHVVAATLSAYLFLTRARLMMIHITASTSSRYHLLTGVWELYSFTYSIKACIFVSALTLIQRIFAGESTTNVHHWSFSLYTSRWIKVAEMFPSSTRRCWESWLNGFLALEVLEGIELRDCSMKILCANQKEEVLEAESLSVRERVLKNFEDEDRRA